MDLVALMIFIWMMILIGIVTFRWTLEYGGGLRRGGFSMTDFVDYDKKLNENKNFELMKR
jgi:hypothetical protein